MYIYLLKKYPLLNKCLPTPFPYHPSGVSGISHHAVLLRDHDQQDGFVRLKHEWMNLLLVFSYRLQIFINSVLDEVEQNIVICQWRAATVSAFGISK